MHNMGVVEITTWPVGDMEASNARLIGGINDPTADALYRDITVIES